MGGTTLRSEMTMKFKVGQTVEVVNNDGMSALIGATAVVTGIGRGYINVVWKRDSKWNNQMDGGYYPKDFRPMFTKGQQLLFSFMKR